MASDIPTLTPVFIIGCPRSGTTMLASQLAATEQTLALPEMPWVSWLAETDTPDETAARRLFHKLEQNFFFRALRIPYGWPDFSTVVFDEDRRKRIYSVIAAWARHNQVDLGQKRIWVEHAPIQRERVYRLLKHFPDARFVHIVRDPRAVYASMHRMPMWNTHDPVQFSKFWANAVARCSLLASQMPERVVEVRYEDYVNNPEQELSRLAGFVGLGLEEGMLQGGAVPLPRFTRAQHQLTSGPAVKDRLESWRDEIAPREAEAIAGFCHPWMVKYHYAGAGEFFREASRRERQLWALRQALLTPYSKLMRLVQQRA